MKTILCTLLFVICVSAAFSQTPAAVNGTAEPLSMSDHPQHAIQHEMRPESTLLDTAVYSYAKGEVPLSDLGSIQYEIPLGDVARAYRKEHASSTVKAVKVLEK